MVPFSFDSSQAAIVSHIANSIINIIIIVQLVALERCFVVQVPKKMYLSAALALLILNFDTKIEIFTASYQFKTSELIFWIVNDWESTLK